MKSPPSIRPESKSADAEGQQVSVLRIAPSGTDRISLALEANAIIMAGGGPQVCSIRLSTGTPSGLS